MEFKFPVNEIFKQPIVEINCNLIPPGFSGDRRAYWDTVGKVSEVINAIGEASAAAQGLSKPITTAERLRNSEHTVYLLVDQNASNGRGAVTGMLKTGKKGLYVFDRNGQHYQVSPPCVLDFYVNEARQRTGLGKRLFEHMLQKENIEPVKMAIDRPSEKLLGFLNKHYTLNNPVKQMNNYVVFDGFFPNTPEEKNRTVEVSPSGGALGRKQSANGLQSSYASPLGRYGAPRPPCSMGQIIHNQTSTLQKTAEPTGVSSSPETNFQNSTGYSSTTPTNITQSMPNVYYRPPEQAQQNPGHQLNEANNMRYYQQQQQSENMWQNFGKTSNYIQSPANISPETHNNQQNMYVNNNPMQNTQQIQQPGAYTSQMDSQNIQGQNTAMYQNVANMHHQGTMPHMEQIHSANVPAQVTQQIPQTSPAISQPVVMPPRNINSAAEYAPQTVQSQAMVQPSSQMQSGWSVVEHIQQPGHNSEGASSQRNEPQNQMEIPNQNPQLVGQSQAMMPIANLPRQNEVAPAPNQMPSQYHNPQLFGQQAQSMRPSTNLPHQNEVVPVQNQISNQYQNAQPIGQQSHSMMTGAQNQYYMNNEALSQNQRHLVQQQPVAQSRIDFEQVTANQTAAYQQQQPGYGLPTSQFSYSTPQTTLQSTSPQQNQVDAQIGNIQPVVTQSVPNTTAMNPQNVVQQSYDRQTMPNQNAVYQRNVGQYNVDIRPQPPQMNRGEYPKYMEGNQLNLKKINVQLPQENNAKGDMNPVVENEQLVAPFGYPPQSPKVDTQIVEEKVSSSPKLERPRSLSIQLSEEQTEDKKNNDVESEVLPTDEVLIEVVEKLTVDESDVAPVIAKDEVSRADGGKSPGKKTPSHLTEQGFFDLKFYHNKLW